MNRFRAAGFGVMALCLFGCLGDDQPGINTGGNVPSQANPTLSVDDVSWLFPAPVTAADLASVIAIKDVTAPDAQNPGQRVAAWPQDAFAQFIAIADGPHGEVNGSANRISLPPEVRSIDAWRIAGIRIDAGAPGLADPVRAQFGQSPQIRLILHPVTENADGSVVIHDIAAHLIFSFVQDVSDAPAAPGCFTRPRPDMAAFRQIVSEAADLRTRLASGVLGDKVTTAGAPLGVHPGLKNPRTAPQVRADMKAFLERHISGRTLSAMAVMGLPGDAGAPWVFLSMLRVPAGVSAEAPQGGFVAVRGPMLDGTQFAQMLTPLGDSPRVQPVPHNNNLSPITCASGVQGPAALPVLARKGVATADILADPAMPAARVKQILATIEDPAASHFFNTDCVSCHTDTRIGMEVLGISSVPGIDTDALPNGPYNVRNFGWSPPIEGPPSRATATRRTLAETEAVVRFINAELLAD